MSYFDINILIDESMASEQKQHSVYEKILLKIYKKIKIINKRKQYNLVYEVPNYMFGHALYNVRACIVFIMVALRKKGLFVKYQNPNILIISWKNAILQNYKKMSNNNNRRTYDKNSFNKINIVNKMQSQQVQNPNIKPKEINMSKINNNLINSFENPQIIQNNTPSHNSRNLDNLIAMSKYL